MKTMMAAIAPGPASSGVPGARRRRWSWPRARGPFGLAAQQVQGDHQQQPPATYRLGTDARVDEELLTGQGEGGDDERGHDDRLPGGPAAPAGGGVGGDGQEHRDTPTESVTTSSVDEALGKEERVDREALLVKVPQTQSHCALPRRPPRRDPAGS
jgi:hypothetical protein